jgi:predicted nucleic acid-binding protein
VEYWLGNEAMKEWIEERTPIFTSAITLAESVRYFVASGKDQATICFCLDDVRARSTVIPVDETIAIAAGQLKKREVHGIADSIILATARARNHNVVTGDPHFKGIVDAVYLGP